MSGRCRPPGMSTRDFPSRRNILPRQQIMEAQRLAKVKACQDQWRRRLSRVGLDRLSTDEYADSLPTLLIIVDIIEAGPAPNEDTDEFSARIRRSLKLYWYQRNVVGRLQKECKPGNDPGDDEDG